MWVRGSAVGEYLFCYVYSPIKLKKHGVPSIIIV